MLNESKYNLAITPAPWRAFKQPILFLAVLLIATLFTHSSEWFVCVVVVAFMLYRFAFIASKSPSATQYVTFSESGEWRIQSADDHAWQMNANSKLMPFALFIELTQSETGRRCSLWIWPSEVSSTAYRRLSRVVFRKGIQ